MSMDPSEPQEPTTSVQETDTDPARLVDAFTASGEWPDPELLDRILAAGEAVVEPLRALVRTRPRDWPAVAPVQYAAGLLGDLGAEAAVPELKALVRDYLDEVSDEAVGSLCRLGSEGFQALLELLEDPGVVGYQRWSLIEMTTSLGTDPDRESRLAEVLRGLLARGIEEFKSTKAFESELVESSDQARDRQDDVAGAEEVEGLEQAFDPDEEFDEFSNQVEETTFSNPESEREWEQAENELLPEEGLATIASGLCDLADPLAREMIESAFKESMIDESILTEETFQRCYKERRRRIRPESPWIENYKELLSDHRESEARLSQMAPLDFPSRTSYPSFEPAPSRAPAYPPPPPVEPIRHAGPRIGRNDPCWCGSGKKYKKCHLGKDTGA